MEGVSDICRPQMGAEDGRSLKHLLHSDHDSDRRGRMKRIGIGSAQVDSQRELIEVVSAAHGR